MIGVDCVAKAKTICQKRATEQNRIVAEREERPPPGDEIEDDQSTVNAGRLHFRAASLTD
jgi:hypothetical protein